MLRRNKQTGVTLIELIIAMLIVSVALLGILSVVNQTTVHSADPLINHQAVAIAESYLEEILLFPVVDPDGSNTGETRATFDNVGDYAGLNEPPTDRSGTAIANLSNYTVSVTITDVTLSATLMKEVNVTVTRGVDVSISIKGYRASY